MVNYYTSSKDLPPSLRYQVRPQNYIVNQLLSLSLGRFHQGVDTVNCCARIFFVDFSKGSDIINHNILLQELSSLNVDQPLCVWIRAFLTNRTQAVRVGISLSPWCITHGGVPQGTKLGITLFAIMINRLLGDWHTTVFEIMPRNSTSLLDFAVRDIHKHCIERSMRLNQKNVKRWS